MLSHKQFHTPSPQRIVVFLRLHQKVRAPVPFHMLKRCLESAANIPQAHFMSKVLPAEAAFIAPAAVFVQRGRGIQAPEACCASLVQLQLSACILFFFFFTASSVWNVSRAE